jgi:hypothetical protein
LVAATKNSTNYELKIANNRTKPREDCGTKRIVLLWFCRYKFELIRPCAFLSQNFFLKRSMPMTQAARAAKNARYRQKMSVMHNMLPGFFSSQEKTKKRM